MYSSKAPSPLVAFSVTDVEPSVSAIKIAPVAAPEALAAPAIVYSDSWDDRAVVLGVDVTVRAVIDDSRIARDLIADNSLSHIACDHDRIATQSTDDRVSHSGTSAEHKERIVAF